MDKFCELEAFATVVDQGGFTDAARQMGVSKSSVSKHVASLETRLGARLLNRSTRRVSPTEIGTAYYDRVRRVLSEANEADTLVSNMQSEPTGLLKVGCEADFGVRVLVPLLKDFKEQFPLVRLDIELHRNAKNLIAQGWDVSICVGPMRDSELRSRKVGGTSMRLVAHPDYIAEHGKPQTIDALKDHQLIHNGGTSDDSSWRIIAPSGETRQVRNLGDLAINDGASQLAAAQAGLGIAYLPDFLSSKAIENASLVEVMPSLPEKRLGIYALHSTSQYTPPKIRAFVDFLAHSIG